MELCADKLEHYRTEPRTETDEHRRNGKRSN